MRAEVSERESLRMWGGGCGGGSVPCESVGVAPGEWSFEEPRRLVAKRPWSRSIPGAVAGLAEATEGMTASSEKMK